MHSYPIDVLETIISFFLDRIAKQTIFHFLVEIEFKTNLIYVQMKCKKLMKILYIYICQLDSKRLINN